MQGVKMQLLREICQLKLRASLFNYDLSCPSFADDMPWCPAFPLVSMCSCSLHISISTTGDISSVTTKHLRFAFGESPAEHSKNKQTRNWSLGPDNKYEEDEYANLGVYKNYCGSFSG